MGGELLSGNTVLLRQKEKKEYLPAGLIFVAWDSIGRVEVSYADPVYVMFQ